MDTINTHEIFLSQLKNILIPSIEKMIVKEKEHIEKMESKRGKRSSDLLIDTFVSDSKERLTHYEQRLKEYNEYQQNQKQII